MNIYRYSLLLALIAIIKASGVNAQCATSTLSVYNITADSVTISWIGTVGGPDYEYAVLPATVTTPPSGTFVAGPGGATLRIGGLTVGTAYKAWLRSACGSGVYTPWVPLSFSTPCGMPATLNVSNIGADSAVISWASVAPTASYEYVVDTSSNTPSANGTLVSTNTVTKKGLLPGKTYYAFVRTACASVFSPWSSGMSFFSAFPTTVPAFNGNAAISAYPNPVTSLLHISNLPAHCRLAITSTIGTVLYNNYVEHGTVDIDMQAYPAGVYILRYIDGVDTRALKIEKR